MNPTPQPKSCPLCGGETERGSVSVHGTILGFLFYGLSLQHCWFEGPVGKQEIVLGSRTRRPGFRCRACGFVGMFGNESPL